MDALSITQSPNDFFLDAIIEDPSSYFTVGVKGPCLRKSQSVRSMPCYIKREPVMGMRDTNSDGGNQGMGKPTKRRKGSWALTEDNLLRAVVNGAGHNPKWSEVAKEIPGRTAKQCRERWSCNLDPMINRGPWSPNEDRDIIHYQRILGNKWALIAKNLPGRTENAVKTRYKSIMRAYKREWSEHEDELVITLHKQHGSDWALIAESLPKRTKNAVKTRHRLLMRGEALKQPEYGSPSQIIFEDRINRQSVPRIQNFVHEYDVSRTNWAYDTQPRQRSCHVEYLNPSEGQWSYEDMDPYAAFPAEAESGFPHVPL